MPLTTHCVFSRSDSNCRDLVGVGGRWKERVRAKHDFVDLTVDEISEYFRLGISIHVAVGESHDASIDCTDHQLIGFRLEQKLRRCNKKFRRRDRQHYNDVLTSKAGPLTPSMSVSLNRNHGAV